MIEFRKIGIVTLFLFIVSQSSSQLNIGIQGGFNFATVNQDYKYPDEESELKIRLLYSAGTIIDYRFTNKLGIQSGLSFSSKGFALDLKKEYDYANSYYRFIINYLEIPVLMRYTIKKIQIYTGPYLAVGLNGKHKYHIDSEDNQYNETYEEEIIMKLVLKEYDGFEFMETGEIPVKRMDYGLHLGVGYQTGPVLVNLGYSLGLLNLEPPEKDIEFYDEIDPADYKYSNRVVVLSVSYFFGNK